MKTRLLLLAAVAVALSLLALPVSTAGSSSGGTTVVVNGDNVDIHISLDIVLSGLPALANRETNAITTAAQQAVALWNQAFAESPAGCLHLHLDLSLKVIPVREGEGLQTVTNGGLTYPVTSPGHHVAVWLTGEESERPTVWDPFASTWDSSSPYNDDLPAQWDDILLDPRAFAHELGHLMGLDDDYVDVPGMDDSIPLPGRDGTMMANGGTIDQDLLDGLADVLAKADPDVPKCKVWEGPIHLDASVTGIDHDRGTADGKVRVVEQKDGSLTGTISVHRTSGCDRYSGQKSFDIRVRGRRASHELVIESFPSEVVTDSMGEPICGFPDGFFGDQGEKGSPVKPFVVPLVSKTTASGRGTIDDKEKLFGSTEDDLITGYTINLERHDH